MAAKLHQLRHFYQYLGTLQEKISEEDCCPAQAQQGLGWGCGLAAAGSAAWAEPAACLELGLRWVLRSALGSLLCGELPRALQLPVAREQETPVSFLRCFIVIYQNNFQFPGCEFAVSLNVAPRRPTVHATPAAPQATCKT